MLEGLSCINEGRVLVLRLGVMLALVEVYAELGRESRGFLVTDSVASGGVVVEALFWLFDDTSDVLEALEMESSIL